VPVTVLLFASYADAFGRPSLRVELPPGSTVKDLVTYLSTLPRVRDLPDVPLVAVNAEYARADQILAPGDEVAIIPPVAGG
jgi:molybdopterin converting factor subunit 1